MSELAYQARWLRYERSSELPRVEAKNCVYHDLARGHLEVCQFDLQLLAGLMGLEITQIDREECMVAMFADLVSSRSVLKSRAR